MKRRHLYVVLFAIPALLVSAVVAALLLAAAAGALWLFVLGDDPWPAAASVFLGMLFGVAAAGVWVGLLSAAYAVGTREEQRPALNAGHVALSIGATIVLAALIAMRMTGVSFPGGEPTDDVRCADLCRAEGFSGSGMPPRASGDRTCTCYDAQGREARRISLSGTGNSSPR